jgi:hypothetical protein
VYQKRITFFGSKKKQLEAESGRIALARLALFAGMVITLYFTIKLKSHVMLILPLILTGGFLYLLKRSVVTGRKIRFYKILTGINADEVKALDGDYSAFETGAGFIDYHHEYSYDLDIFGEHSLYRMVNRTATPLGKEKLAGRLLYPGTDPGQIRLRQEAVRELEAKLSWRQDFLATARESNWEKEQSGQIRAWLDAPDKFNNTRFYRAAIWINSIISLSLALLYILDILLNDILIFSVSPVYSLYFLLPISLIISRSRLITREQEKLERLLDRFRKYGGLLEMIEKEEFSAPYLKELKKSMIHGSINASQVMKKLTGILWGLEVRGNLIVSFFLNAFFLWDILLMIRLEQWRRNYHHAFGKWIEVIAEIEVLNSLATLAYNRNDFSWPEIREGAFNMEIVNGGHPLIHPSKRIDNSLNFDLNGQIYLVTGANMAGKSTLLRMAGVNMILAMSGGPVCAERFGLVPVSIHTSVRTNDSLGEDESYFYAELKKLSRIISRLEEGENIFVIIDEMLKGTNSHDKHAGSAALIRRLMDFKASGLVATHDVELGELEKEYPERLKNSCFEVITEGDQLKFDYRLYPGVSKSLNATFLMKKMGIIKT